MILEGTGLRLRTADPGDLEALASIWREPGVIEWWGDLDLEQIESELADATGAFIIEVDSEIAGLIQYFEEDDPMYRSAAIDIFLGRAYQRRGFGSEALRVLARYLFDERGHHRLTIDPAVANTAAVSCYEKVGFRPVGVMRNYERGLDGTWHDGLLMDMLVGELV